MKILQEFYQWVHSLRRSGTSTLLQKIAEKEDVYVLVGSEKEKNDPKWGGKALSFDDLKRSSLPPKPILVDNYFMLEIAERAYRHQTKIETELAARNVFLHRIKYELESFENKWGNFDGSPKKGLSANIF